MSSLHPKEVEQHETVSKSYRTKDYEIGLKIANMILEDSPNHGGALSGLMLNCIDLKSKPYKFTYQGLTIDITSNVCWHVCGLLYQSDKLYGKAMECYQNALMHDPYNLELLRHFSLVQAQTRNGNASTLCHNGSKVDKILEAYEATFADSYPLDSRRDKNGELLLYQISLLEECGFLERALEELQKKEAEIVDRLAVKELQASLLVKLNRFEDGEKIYRVLLSENPNNYRYYAGLQKCVGLSPENGQYAPDKIEKLDIMYKSLKQYNSSSAVKRIPLDFLQGKKFVEAADIYIRPLLTEGVLSLYTDLCPLYEHPGKGDLIEQLILNLESSIMTTGGYPGSMEKEPPSTLLWTRFLLAQHYDRRGQYEAALAKIVEAIHQNPAVIQLYTVEGRIMKHLGFLTAAAALANKARCMDLANNLLNQKCVKRMLLADQISLAGKTALAFRQVEAQQNNLHDLWYDLASGESYFRQGDFECALEKFLAVAKHCQDKTVNLFDFHSSYLSKVTLGTYVKMSSSQDRLYSHSYLQKAATGAIRCYIKLYDSTPKVDDEIDDETSKSLLSQNIKIKQKQIKVENPLLLEATKYLKLLQNSSSESLETHLLSFELSMRKEKVLLALQAVTHLLRLDQNSPDTHCCLIRFLSKLYNMPAPVTSSEILVCNVLKATLSRQTPPTELSSILFEKHRELILPFAPAGERPFTLEPNKKSDFINFIEDIACHTPLTELNKVFLHKHKDSLMHRAAAAEMSFLLEPHKKSEFVKLIEDTVNVTLGPVNQCTLKDCIAVHQVLGTGLSDLEAASRWKAQCSKLFPLSSYFNPPVWLLDSGANCHFTNNILLLHDTTILEEAVAITTADGGGTSSCGVGSSLIHSSFPSGLTIHLNEVYVCSGFEVNIISVPELVSHHPHVVEFTGDGYFIRDKKYEELINHDLLIACGSFVETGKDRYVYKAFNHRLIPPRNVEWVLDSGASSHATPDESILQNVGPCTRGTITTASGRVLEYSKMGSYVISIVFEDGVSYELVLRRVLVVDGLGRNVISVRTLTEENACSVVFSFYGYYILNRRNGGLDDPDSVCAAGRITDGKYLHASQLLLSGKVLHSYDRRKLNNQ